MQEQLINMLTKDQVSKGIEEVDKKFAEWIQQLPPEYKSIVVDVLDRVIYGLGNFCQQKSKILDMERKILVEARLFQEDLASIEDMSKLSVSQLEYLENKWRTKYGNYALIEGGVAGLGHPLGLLFDFPALLAINLNMVQAIASTYGYSLRYPPEQIIALKVLHAGSLPQSYADQAWEWLLNEYESQGELGLYNLDENTIIQPEWLETLAKQWVKSIGLYGLKKTTKQKLSLIGAVIGAGLNYQFTSNLGQFAAKFYRYRFEQEQHNSQGYEDEE